MSNAIVVTTGLSDDEIKPRLGKFEARTEQKIGDMRDFPHFLFAQVGRVDFLGGLPVQTGQSLARCSSIRALGSSSRGIAMGCSHTGPAMSQTVMFMRRRR